MPSIPGLTDYGTIPRLGQGSPGGRAGTTGLPGGPSQSNIPGLPTLSAIPRVGAPLSSAPVIPSPSLVNRNTAALDSGAMQHTKQRLDAAMQILMRVHTGQLDATRAAKMLDDLSPEERQTLTRTVLNNHARNGGAPPTDELKALRYLPLGKAAGETAPLDPTHKTGFGTNLLRDAVQSVVNLPAGLALTGKAIGSDIGDVVTHPLSPHPFQGGTSTHGEFERQVVDPIGKSYAQTYGPLAHGDLGEFSKRFQQHPLGPILDAATLLSGGLGAAGRGAEAASALRAGRLAEEATPGVKLFRGDKGPVQRFEHGKGGGDQSLGPGVYMTPSRDLADTFTQDRWLMGNLEPADPTKTSGVISEASVPKSVLSKMHDASKPMSPSIKQAVLDSIKELKRQLTTDPAGVRFHDPEIEGEFNHIHDEIRDNPKLTIADLHREIPELSNGHAWDLGREAGTFDEGEFMPNFWDELIPRLQAKGIKGFRQDVSRPTEANQWQGLYDAPKSLDLGKHEYSLFDPEEFNQLRAGTHPAQTRTSVGGQYTVHAGSDGRHSVRDTQGRLVSTNFPDQASAVKHAQSLISPFAGKPIQAFLKGGGERGRLIDRYEAARGFNHDQEIQQTMKEVSDVLDNSNLRVDRRSFKQVLSEVKGDLTRTAIQDRNLPARIAQSNIGFLQSAPVRGTLAAGQIALREASDLVRAGAIYLRPAYLPNNWAGNLFMNAVHQGVLAPVNLAKSMVIDKYIGARYTAAMDKSMGQNAAEVVTAARGRGYVGSLTNPLAHSMGMIADQPFRRAAFLHEARRAGYSKLTDVKSLFDRAAAKDEKALRQIGEISRRAQEEIVKFGHMNDTEREVIRNLIFVYSWVRGASRYAARFPLQHPIQSDVFHHIGQDVGKPYVQRELGGVPSYLLGAIPVGHDKNGNPILINPFSLNPLGTGVDLGRAVAGTMKVIRGDKTFNKFADQDVANLTNPLVQSYLSAREGGKTPKTQLEQTIAPIRLIHDLQHPGSGSVFPTSRTEALGHYVVGAMFPRVADQAALQRSLEREQQFDPVARIPEEMKVYSKATGSPVPPDLEKFYRQDLVQVQTLKDFQHHYASSHGQSGYRNLPPANKVEAAIQFLRSHGYASDAQVAEYKKEAAQLTNDADLNSFANGLFSTTGIGQYKLVWDQMMRDAKGLRLSRKRG